MKKEDRHENDDVNRHAKIKHANGFFGKHMHWEKAFTKEVSKRESNEASMVQHQGSRRQECKPKFP